jgi:hypothetical protein
MTTPTKAVHRSLASLELPNPVPAMITRSELHAHPSSLRATVCDACATAPSAGSPRPLGFVGVLRALRVRRRRRRGRWGRRKRRYGGERLRRRCSPRRARDAGPGRLRRGVTRVKRRGAVSGGRPRRRRPVRAPSRDRRRLAHRVRIRERPALHHDGAVRVDERRRRREVEHLSPRSVMRGKPRRLSGDLCSVRGKRVPGRRGLHLPRGAMLLRGLRAEQRARKGVGLRGVAHAGRLPGAPASVGHPLRRRRRSVRIRPGVLRASQCRAGHAVRGRILGRVLRGVPVHRIGLPAVRLPRRAAGTPAARKGFWMCLCAAESSPALLARSQ